MVSETVLPFYVKVEPDSFLHYIMGTLNPWQLVFNKTSLPAYPQVKNFDTNLPKLKISVCTPQTNQTLLSSPSSKNFIIPDTLNTVEI